MNCIDTIQKDAVIEFVLLWTVSRSLLYVTYIMNFVLFIYILIYLTVTLMMYR